MTKKQQIQFTMLVTLGLLSIFGFAVFWFNPTNIAHNFDGLGRLFDVALFLIVTYIVWLPIFMKVLTWSIASHIRAIPSPTPQDGLKVAFITTFVPASESKDLLHQILPAMVNVKYPHDTWLLDEGNDADVRAICLKYGVNHFSRAGKEHYNQQDGKFTRKTKGGNHNSWYDTAGNNYDFVAQMDTDFVPSQNYLHKTLGFFKDTKIAFVGTPQVYGNTRQSIIARGAAEQTYNFYGPLLRGMDGMNTTLLIGANHVIRVAALKAVGHYSAHITEDLLTGMKLHSRGWTSVYVPEVLAVGEGPVTWKSYFDQQKRWAYGCMHILHNYSFKLFKSMPLRRIIYYLSIQQYYFTGIAMLLSIIALSLYFFAGIQSLDLNLIEFLRSYIPLLILIECVNLWLQQFNIRPEKERGIMWGGMYVGVAVWPIYMMAYFALFKRKKLVYKVTPKGGVKKKQPASFILFMPHVILGLISLAGFISSFFTHRNSAIMLFWSLLSGTLLLAVPVIPSLLKTTSRLSSQLGQLLNRYIFLNASTQNGKTR